MTPKWMIDAAQKFSVPHDPGLIAMDIVALCRMIDAQKLIQNLVELQRKAYEKGLGDKNATRR